MNRSLLLSSVVWTSLLLLSQWTVMTYGKSCNYITIFLSAYATNKCNEANTASGTSSVMYVCQNGVMWEKQWDSLGCSGEPSQTQYANATLFYVGSNCDGSDACGVLHSTTYYACDNDTYYSSNYFIQDYCIDLTDSSTKTTCSGSTPKVTFYADTKCGTASFSAFGTSACETNTNNNVTTYSRTVTTCGSFNAYGQIWMLLVSLFFVLFFVSY